VKKEEEKRLQRNDWVSNFNLIGKVSKINDFTFKIDKEAEKSDWVYNALSLPLDCGERYGVVYSEMMSGYGKERDNVIYAHGKKEDGSDDFNRRITVDWDDRNDKSVLEDIGDFCFVTVGLEKDAKGRTLYKKFLSPYDATAYIEKHLEEGMVLNVKGNLKYSLYNNRVITKKTINSIVLSKVDDSSKYKATFTQSVLLLKDSIGEEDKEKSVIQICAKVLDYIKEIKGQAPFDMTFEYEVDLSKKELVRKIKTKLFKVRRGITQINFEGDFIEGGATITATEDDIPEDIKVLIEIGAYTLEEALAKCSENGNKEQRMVLRKPVIKMVGEEGEKVPVIQKFEERYTEDELFAVLNDAESKGLDDDDNEDDETKSEEIKSTEDDMDWLNNLK